jgi:hypothetical protein
MAKRLIGGVTLLAIFLAFVNGGTPLGRVFTLVSTVGLLIGTWNLRTRLRANPPSHTRITR